MNWAIPSVLYALMVYLLLRRLRLMSIALLGILFSLTWMTISAAYLDSHPGVYAEEMYRRIGGGWSALRLVSFYGVMVLAILLVFTRKRLARLERTMAETRPRDIKINNQSIYLLSNIALGVFVAALYVKLLCGPIPLLTGMDRVTYRVTYDHLLLTGLYKYCSFISFFAGVLLLYQIRLGRRGGINTTVALYLLILVYFILIGNKFSTPFFSLCMFLMPLGLLHMLPRNRDTSPQRRKRLLVAAVLATIVVTTLLGAGLYKYYSSYGSTEHIKRRLVQRVGVKQAQLWWMTTRRIYERDEWAPSEAFEGIFTNPPFESKGNTALLYLICRNVGSRRAFFFFSQGYLYTGAFPTVLLVLAGPVGAYAAMLVLSLVLATLLYLMYRAIALYHYPTIFFLAFVLQPFVFAYLGGNLYFFVKTNYAVKVCLALLALAYDNRRGLALIMGAGADPSSPEATSA